MDALQKWTDVSAATITAKPYMGGAEREADDYLAEAEDIQAAPSGSDSGSEARSGGGINLLSGAFLVALVGAGGWFLMQRSGGSLSGAGEAIKNIAKPAMAKSDTPSPASRKPAPKSSERSPENRATPETSDEVSSESGSSGEDPSGHAEEPPDPPDEPAESDADLRALYDSGTAPDTDSPDDRGGPFGR